MSVVVLHECHKGRGALDLHLKGRCPQNPLSLTDLRIFVQKCNWFWNFCVSLVLLNSYNFGFQRKINEKRLCKKIVLRISQNLRKPS